MNWWPAKNLKTQGAQRTSAEIAERRTICRLGELWEVPARSLIRLKSAGFGDDLGDKIRQGFGILSSCFLAVSGGLFGSPAKIFLASLKDFDH